LCSSSSYVNFLFFAHNFRLFSPSNSPHSTTIARKTHTTHTHTQRERERETPMPECGNPLLLSWLQEWADAAMQYQNRAYQTLRKVKAQSTTAGTNKAGELEKRKLNRLHRTHYINIFFSVLSPSRQMVGL
jgi:hypothetical protein